MSNKEVGGLGGGGEAFMCINNHNIKTLQQRFSPYTHTHARTHTRTHARTHTRTHTHTHAHRFGRKEERGLTTTVHALTVSNGCRTSRPSQTRVSFPLHVLLHQLDGVEVHELVGPYAHAVYGPVLLGPLQVGLGPLPFESGP